MLNNVYRLIKKDGLPIHLIFHVTYKCNSRCVMCFLWKQIESKIKNELSTDEIKKISKNFKNMLWLQIGGGEPFLRNDLPQICSFFSYSNNISIPTNCLLPKTIETHMGRILSDNSKSNFLVTLSLDGIGKLHDKIRGVTGNFKKFNETYVRLDKLRGEFPNLELSVNTTIFNYNCNELEEIRDYVRNNLDVSMHSFEFMRGRPKGKLLQLPDLKKCKEINDMIINNINFYSYGNRFFSNIIKKIKLHEQEIILKTMSEKEKQIECYAGRLSAVINPHGDVFVCEDIREKLGNLRKSSYDFRDIWFSDKANLVRNRVKNCFCTHSCFNLINILFNKKELIKSLIF